MDEKPTPITYYNKQFPSPLLPKNIMDKPETGRALASAIYYTAIDGQNSYYSIRNSSFSENRTFAQGRQPFQTYLDILGVDGKTAFMNLDYHPRPVAPKFRDILVNEIMDKVEKVECTGLSLEMQKRKDDRKNEMAFRMQHPEFIDQLQKTSGMQFGNPNEYVPQNEDELELWDKLNDKEREEELMEYGLDFIMYNNDWNSIKKEVATDLVEVGLAGTQTYFDGRKRIRIKRIRPEYTIYGTTNTLDFRNMPYMAHVERLQVTDLRCMYPDYPEKKIWQYAYEYRNLNGNPNELSDFIIDFENAYTRPYDSWLIDVLFFEYKVSKTIDYVDGKDKNDNPVFEYRKGKPTNPNKKPGIVRLPTIYKGAWVMNAENVLEWGEMTNLIRSNEDVEDLKFSYSMYMLNNNGDMFPLSPVAAMRSSIIQMDLSILRMQHTIATTPPNGILGDLDSIMEVDLGKGIGKLGPMKMRELYTQTGDIWYSGSKIDGTKNPVPIQQLVSSFGDKLKSYIEIYNFELNNIRDYIGVNEVKDGTDINPRMGLGVMQGAQQASNTAISHLYGGVVSITENVAKSAAILFWDALNTDTTNDMYIRILGKVNADFMNYRDELTKTNYSTRISVNMSQQEMFFIEETLKTSLQQGKLMPEDALMVRKYAQFNTEYAIRYMSLQTKRREKMMQQAQMQQQQATAQQAQQMMQEKAVIEQKKQNGELMKVDRKGAQDYRTKVQDLINQSVLLEQQTGAPIPAYVQNLINLQLASHLQEQQAQIEQIEAQLYGHDLQVLAQSQQPQQGGQPQPQQGQAA